MKIVEYQIKGLGPTLQHNGRGADQTDEQTIALHVLAKKSKKTLEDHKEIARLK